MNADIETEYHWTEHAGHWHVNVWVILAVWALSRGIPSSFQIPVQRWRRWGNSGDPKVGTTGITLAVGWERKCMHNIRIFQFNSWFLCSILSCSYLCPYAQRYSNANDGRLNAGSWRHTMHICICDAQLNSVQAYGSILALNICTQHASFCVVSTDQNTNNKWWTIHTCANERCSVHTMHVCTFDAWTNLECMCSAVMGSNTCVQLRTWVCPYRHHVGARQQQFRLERIRREWSKTMVRKNAFSEIEQSRRIENRLVRLRSEKSSKFWKLKTRLRTPQ